MFLSGFAYSSFQLLRKYKLLGVLFPLTEKYLLEADAKKEAEQFLQHALLNTDKRWAEEKPVAQPFLLAVFLWYPLKSLAEKKKSQGLSEYLAYLEAFHEILHVQQKALAIPKRLVQIIREIWSLQLHLKNRAGKRAARLYANPRFRAAYDFMILRGEAGDQEAKTLASWWHDYIAADEVTRQKMASNIQPPKRKFYRRPAKTTEK